MCTASTALHLGDLHVNHAHSLERGLPIRAFSCYRKQSDLESAERIAWRNFVHEGLVQVHWAGQGHLAFAVILRMAARATWSEMLWRNPVPRLMHNLTPYHFFFFVGDVQNGQQNAAREKPV